MEFAGRGNMGFEGSGCLVDVCLSIYVEYQSVIPLKLSSKRKLVEKGRLGCHTCGLESP